MWRGRLYRRAQDIVRAVLALVLIVGLTLAAYPRAVTYAAGTPLRQVDWPSVLANDPGITIDPNAYQMPVDIGPYISVAAPGSQQGDALEGYASINDIKYADLDGDGAEEAVVPIESGGTGGSFG